MLAFILAITAKLHTATVFGLISFFSASAWLVVPKIEANKIRQVALRHVVFGILIFSLIVCLLKMVESLAKVASPLWHG